MDYLREGEARERYAEGYPWMKGVLEIMQGGGAVRPRILPSGVSPRTTRSRTE